MKKTLSILLILIVLCVSSIMPISAAPADTQPTFEFILTADGKDTVEVDVGDIVTVMLRLRRTDASTPYKMYGMQSELRYDSDFLELVEESASTYTGVLAKDIESMGGYHEYYLSFLSMSNGTSWNSDTLIGSFQLRVVGEGGVTKLTNEDFLITLPDGSGGFECTSNELLFILSTDCTVTFRTSGGSELAPITVQFGETLGKLEVPTREGYVFEGWYTDIHLKNRWDAESDAVQSNMTLYAKWGLTEQIETDEAPELSDDKPDGEAPQLGLIAAICVLILLAVLLVVLVMREMKKARKTGKGRRRR